MLIIIEGPDRTGKTTLAKHLQETFCLDYIHCSKPKTDNPYLEYLELIDSIKKPTVIDRVYFSEFVYGNLWRGKCGFSDKQFEDLDFKYMEKFGYVFVIHADAPTETIKQRCIECGEDLLKFKEIDKCRELFDTIIERTKIPVVKYDSSYMRPEDVSTELCRLAKEF